MSNESDEFSTSSKKDVLEVVSEVNTFFIPASGVKPILDPCNTVAKLTLDVPKGHLENSASSSSGTISEVMETPKVETDEDGDLLVTRKKDFGKSETTEISMLIEYRNSTPLDAVGLQIWRGAFLIGDFIIENVSKFKNKTVMELGAGTGISSIVASMYASRVIATDLDEFGILELMKANVKHNEKLIRCDFHVEPLDFTNLTWSAKLEEFVESADVILAADVVYHERITEAFVGTLKKILSSSSGRRRKGKDVFIAMEKRYVFTLDDLDTVAPMYAHFLEQLESSLNLTPESTCPTTLHTGGGHSVQVSMTEVPLDFPQYFNYEKTKELVLWHIKAVPM